MGERVPLILQKIQKIQEFTNLVERYLAAQDGILKKLLLRQLRQMRERTSEYSAMLIAVGRQLEVPD
jgi:hypothetical protein